MKRKPPWNVLSLVLVVWLCVLPPGEGMAGDWPQVQKNAAHTGYTADRPGLPLYLKWSRDLEEPTQNSIQPIVAEGRVFVGTGWGNVYALDRHTGKNVWKRKTPAPIFASAAYAEGLVFVPTTGGVCYAFHAADGRTAWTFEAFEPFWASPVLADGRLYLADRGGHVYALEAGSGTLIWKADLGSPVMCTPAYADGRFYAAAGDNHIYALDGKTGEQVWKSEQAPQCAMREYWLVAADGVIISPVEMVGVSRRAACRAVRPWLDEHKNDRVLVEEGIFELLRDHCRSHPEHQEYFAVDRETGSEAYKVPIVGASGGVSTAHSPAVSPDGLAYFVYESFRAGGSAPAFFGQMDLDSGRFSATLQDKYGPPSEFSWPGHSPAPGAAWDRSDFSGGFAVGDHSYGISIGGRLAFVVRQHGGTTCAVNVFDLKARRDVSVTRRTDSRGSFAADFHSTSSPAAISGNQLFCLSNSSALICLEGGDND